MSPWAKQCIFIVRMGHETFINKADLTLLTLLKKRKQFQWECRLNVYPESVIFYDIKTNNYFEAISYFQWARQPVRRKFTSRATDVKFKLSKFTKNLSTKISPPNLKHCYERSVWVKENIFSRLWFPIVWLPGLTWKVAMRQVTTIE